MRSRYWMPALLVLYLAFCGWYTPLGGPLREAEIDTYLALLDSRQPPPAPAARARLRRFMEEDTGRAFVMLNLVRLQDADGRATLPAEAALDRYMEYMYPALFARASHPVLYGDAAAGALDIVNAAGMEHWSFSAGMRYRSRRDLLEIATHPDFAAAHEFKLLAMHRTIAFPLEPWFHLGDPRLLLGLLLAALLGLMRLISARGGA